MNCENMVKQVWLMRHGKIDFDYEHCNYDDFMALITDGKYQPLSERHGIDFNTLPQSIDLVCHSQARRAIETAEKVTQYVKAVKVLRLEDLHEVKIDKNIISRKTYNELGSLENRREPILRAWFENKNSRETFNESLERVKRIEQFIENRPEKRILLITHGWFLRLLELYFVQRKGDNIQLKDLLQVNLMKHGCLIEAELKFPTLEPMGNCF